MSKPAKWYKSDPVIVIAGVVGGVLAIVLSKIAMPWLFALLEVMDFSASQFVDGYKAARLG